MKVSISLGGSLLTRGQDAETYRRYAEALRKLKRDGHRLVVVCGGGLPARQYIGMAKQLGGSAELQDRLGILATHLNALLLIAALGEDADERVHRRRSEVARHLDDKILVGGGHMPRSSTDYRAALFASAMGADLIVNATDVGGVYDSNPKTNPDAEQLSALTFKELERIIGRNARQAPGEYGLFDLKAVRLAARLGIPVVFVDGSDPQEIVRAVEGGHSGSVVSG
jgi:uridylate kinase